MRVLIDTGPLVAMLSQRDEHHEWAVHEADQFEEAFLTCEAVLTEAHFLLARSTATGNRRLGALVAAGTLEVPFSYAEHLGA